jgi:hypothetical protein
VYLLAFIALRVTRVVNYIIVVFEGGEIVVTRENSDLPHVWFVMLCMVGTVVSSFSLKRTLLTRFVHVHPFVCPFVS